MPKLLDVAVVMRETFGEDGNGGALLLCFWDERRAYHNILWAPRYLVLSECHAGDRDITVAVSYSIGKLREWAWVIDDERDEFKAKWTNQTPVV